MQECNGKCKNCMDEKTVKELEQILSKYTNDKSNLIQILNEVQEKFGYVPTIAQEEIAKYLGIEVAEVYGVVTFYSRFTLKPKGKYAISVCMGTACFVKGGEQILDMGTACFVKGGEQILERVKQKLGIEEGQTTEDGKFSIDATRCIGACGLAPVFTVNEEVYGKATPQKVDEVIKEYQNRG